MNLLQFLSVSPSFEGGKESVHPYRIACGEWLPRFGAAEAASATRGTGHTTRPARPSTPPEAAAAAGAATPGAARAVGRPRPAELSLDHVEVVRNDLSDSDFEVVRRRPARVVVERTTSTLATLERYAGKRGLHWLSARFFRLGRSQV